jgi:hypothetical protein
MESSSSSIYTRIKDGVRLSGNLIEKRRKYL